MNSRMALIIEGLRSERDHLVADLERVNGALAALGGDTSSPEPPHAAAKPAGDFRCQVAGCDFEGKNQHSLSMHTTRRHKPKKAVQSVVTTPKPAPVGGAEAWRQAAPAIDPPHRCDGCGQRFVSRANLASHLEHGCDTAEVVA
jgi:hypothetical protein